jgi:hypothetical protein
LSPGFRKSRSIKFPCGCRSSADGLSKSILTADKGKSDEGNRQSSSRFRTLSVPEVQPPALQMEFGNHLTEITEVNCTSRENRFVSINGVCVNLTCDRDIDLTDPLKQIFNKLNLDYRNALFINKNIQLTTFNIQLTTDKRLFFLDKFSNSRY